MISKRVRGYIIPIALLLAIVAIFVYATHTLTVGSPTTAGSNVSGNVTLTVTLAPNGADGNTSNDTVRFVANGSSAGSTATFVIGTNTTFSGNSTAALNLTTATILWNTSSVADGIYTLNITYESVNLTAVNHSFGTNITRITVDNNVPKDVILNAPTNNLNQTTSNVTFNFTMIDSFSTSGMNCSVNLDTTTVATARHILNDTSTITSANIGEGTHFWNVTCNDLGSNQNRSTTFRLEVRVTTPKVSLKITDTEDVAKSEFFFGDTVRFSCTRESNFTRYNNTLIQVKGPNTASFSAVVRDTTVATVSATVIHDFTETEELGDYDVRCTTIDRIGNFNSSNGTFKIKIKPPQGTSAFKVRGFEPAVGKILIGAGSTADLGTLTPDGTSRLMAKSATAKITVKGEPHTVVVKSVSEESVTLTVSSTPVDVTINKGETKEVDLNDDGTNDLSITFHKMFKSKADLTFKVSTTPAVPETETGPGGPTGPGEGPGGLKASSSALWVTLIVIILVIVIGYFLIQKKKK